MAIVDPHDHREFRRWLKFNEDGTVASIHEVERSVDQPFAQAVEVTDVPPKNFTAITLSAREIALVKSGKGNVDAIRAAIQAAPMRNGG